MLKAVWMVLAIAAMVGLFASCVVAVAAGVRAFENALDRRRRRRGG